MRTASPPSILTLALGGGLLLLIAFSRWHGLSGFPVFIDEAYLLERMTPFIQQGSIFVGGGTNRMMIAWGSALLFAGGPPDLTLARFSVTLINLVGAAAALSAARLLAGRLAMLAAGLLLALLPYEMFFGRLLLPDSTVASCGMLGVWCAVQYARTGRSVWAIGLGASLALALIAKQTALLLLPLLVTPLVLLPLGRWRMGARGVGLAVAALLAVWIPLYGLLLTRGYAYFGNLGLYSTAGGTSLDVLGLQQNWQAVVEVFLAWVGLPMLALSLLLMAVGLIVAPRPMVAFGGALAAALGGVIVTVTAFRSRYIAFAFPLGALLVSVALGALWASPRRAARFLAVAGGSLIIAWALAFALPFHTQYAADSRQLALWRGDAMEYLSSDSAGFGLDQALGLVQTAWQPHERILGVVSNCMGLRVMADEPKRVDCVAFSYDPGAEAVVGRQVNAAVSQHGAALWLIYEETFLTSRADWSFEYEVIAQFPRPADGLPVWVIRPRP
ncbi:MAG: glycosyltransferase family 39 protein [Anaerolinea sp.]